MVRAVQRMGCATQLIMVQNKRRAQFCQMLLTNGDNFDNVVFTDEAMIQLKPAHRKLSQEG